jgi:hypothetical protein
MIGEVDYLKQQLKLSYLEQPSTHVTAVLDIPAHNDTAIVGHL